MGRELWPVSADELDPEKCVLVTSELQRIHADIQAFPPVDLNDLVEKIILVVEGCHSHCPITSTDYDFSFLQKYLCELECFKVLNSIMKQLAVHNSRLDIPWKSLGRNTFTTLNRTFVHKKAFISNHKGDIERLMSELPELDMIWQQAYSILQLALELSAMGSPNIAATMLDIVAFAARENELQMLNQTWKQVLRISHSAAHSNIEIISEMVSTLSTAYVAHLKKLIELSNPITMLLGIANWYLSQLHALLRTLVKTNMIEALAPGIANMIFLSSILFFQGDRQSLPQCDQLWQLTGGCIATLVQSSNTDEEKRAISIAHLLLGGHEEDVKNNTPFSFTSSDFNASKVLISSLIFRSFDSASADGQCRFLSDGDVRPIDVFFSCLAQTNPDDLTRSSGKRDCMYNVALVGLCVFMHTLYSAAFSALEKAIFSELLSTTPILSFMFVSDLVGYIFLNGSQHVCERWANELFPSLLFHLEENLSMRMRLKLLTHRICASRQRDEPDLPFTLNHIQLDDSLVAPWLRYCACSADAAVSAHREGLSFTDAWDYLCQQLEDDSDPQRVLRCFQSLRLPAMCLVQLCESLKGNDAALFHQSLADIVNILPILLEGSQTAVQLAASDSTVATTWQIVNTIISIVGLAASVCTACDPADIHSVLDALRTESIWELLPEPIVYRLITAHAPVSTSSSYNILPEFFEKGLHHSDWTVVHQALDSLFRYSASSPQGPPALRSDSRNAIVEFIQKKPHRLEGVREAQNQEEIIERRKSFPLAPLRKIKSQCSLPMFRSAVEVPIEKSVIDIDEKLDAIHELVLRDDYKELLLLRQQKLVDIVDSIQTLLNH
ncbi:hypothetical protein, variant 2 [Spizellomyces punctatus DAOM BR117]|uniref:Uncharacterized protein n=1 Tax=Spizellomyces punctatus (strain DAOM BR117) TaxID=645134 RepID=A0A0L0HME6_SPIPD|nr:hypothetical protein, variant 2 [Spizellomyces punctatus DAOM BR117]KND02282.1 hypothetical protein, variant 2 [Spizellomyces punctatus DAOM BR117]|eukprot:XP_016610321.1 hypothetical protein, variant 2 [Spizellomyces punctatus DAOM BR117]